MINFPPFKTGQIPPKYTTDLDPRVKRIVQTGALSAEMFSLYEDKPFAPDQILRVPKPVHKVKDADRYDFFLVVIEERFILGRGTDATVYCVHEINKIDGRYVLNHEGCYALKVAHDTGEIPPVEINLLKEMRVLTVYFDGMLRAAPFSLLDPGTRPLRQVCLMECVPPFEVQMLDKLPAGSPDYSVEIVRRFNAISSLCYLLEKLHHRYFHVHGDLKWSNTLIISKLNEQGARVLSELFPSDFGHAKLVHDLGIVEYRIQASGLYYPPECCEADSYIGTKSDVYMLTAIIARLLGQENSYHERDMEFLRLYPSRVAFEIITPDVHLSLSKIPYCFNSIIRLGFVQCEGEAYDLNELIYGMLTTMNQKIYDRRPSMQIVFYFFFKLGKIIQFCAQNPLFFSQSSASASPPPILLPPDLAVEFKQIAALAKRKFYTFDKGSAEDLLRHLKLLM